MSSADRSHPPAIRLIEPRTPLGDLAPVRPVRVTTPGALRTDRLVLRPLVEADRDEFLRVVAESRGHLARFSRLHMPDETDSELFVRQLALTIDGEATHRACRRIITEPAGRIVGACNLNAIRRGLAWEADCNWWLAPSATGRGYAREALTALLGYAFADVPEGLGLHQVLAGIQAENVASVRLARRLGFAPAGPEKSYLHAGGKWDLHEMFVVSPETFAARRAG